MNPSPRYAVYYAPAPETPLWRFGSSVIGYDAQTGLSPEPSVTLDIEGLDWRAVVTEPRRYGFHATLKAPFYLAQGVNEAVFLKAVATLAGELRQTPLGRLQVRTLSSFIALAPDQPRPGIVELASRIVKSLERFRAPLTQADMARRLESPLSDRQRQLLLDYGYPYVLEEFRFHMTLTGPLHFEFRPIVEAALQREFEARAAPMEAVLDCLTVFRQDRRDLPFRIIQRAPLRG